MTKPKCKACHNKTYHASYNAEDAHTRSKRKSQFDTWNETANAHSRVRKQPHKAKPLQEMQFRKKSIATLHTMLRNKPASMEGGIHSSPAWVIA